MAKEKSIARSMTEGKPLGLLLRFALPLMLGNIFQQMYVVVDTAIVGQLGVTALASVGAADWLHWLFTGIAQGFTQGFGVLMAIKFGEKDTDGLNDALSASALLSAILAAVLLLLGQTTLPWILRIMDTPGDVYPGARLYIGTLFWGLPFSVAFNYSASVLRALGDSKTPLKAMTVASLTNIALDILFVFGFKWGIAGAAVATVIAQGISAAICFCGMRRISFLRFRGILLKGFGALYAKLMRLGVPVAFQNVIIAVGGLIVQATANGFGTLFIAGFTATNKLYCLLEIAAVSLGHAISTYVGQNFGARKFLRLRTGVRTGAWVALGISVLISAVMLTFGRFFSQIFITGTPEEILSATDTAVAYLRAMSLYLPVLYMLYVYRSALQGMGDTTIPMVSGIVEFVCRVGIVKTMPQVFGPHAVFYAEVAAWAGAAILLVAAYYIEIRRVPKSDA